MLDTHTKNSTSERTIDITCWEEVTLTGLNARQKRRFQKHKAAVTAYFTTDASLDEIAKQQDIADASLLAMVEKCLMRHADGQVWGFRALLPGANVVSHTPLVEQEVTAIQETYHHDGDDDITAKRPALARGEPVKIPSILSLPETPCPTIDDEPIDESGDMTETGGMIGASPVTTIHEPVSQSHAVAQESIVVTELAPVMPPSPVLASPDTLPLKPKTSIPIPTMLSFPSPMSVEDAPVGTDVSRPPGLPIADKDAIHRSLRVSDALFAFVLPNDTASHSAYVHRREIGRTRAA